MNGSLSEVVDVLKKQYAHAILQETFFRDELTLEVSKEHLIDVLLFLLEGINPGFETLMDLTGVDTLDPIAGTTLIYFLHNPTTLQRIRVSLFAKRDELVPSVTTVWEGADWYERELFDMFGVCFEGHPDLKRILMPDNWIGHPMRKDYPLTEEPVQFKYGVKPKVPSQIIQVRRKQQLM